jgi:hypothetical protein
MELESEAGFSLKAKADRIIWVSCKSEDMAKCRIGGRQNLERGRANQGHPWIVLIRDGEKIAKAYSKSRHSRLSSDNVVNHIPHFHSTENLLDEEASVQVSDPPFSYDIELKKFEDAGFHTLCVKEKNSFVEKLVELAQKRQQKKRQIDWINDGR